MRLAYALLGPVIAAAACAKTPVVVTRKVTMHAPTACAPRASPYAQFYPFGDFEPPSTVPLPLAEVGAELSGLPADTRELVVDVTDESGGDWRARGLVAPAGDLDLLALPYGSPCALTGSILARTGAVLGAIDRAQVLVVGGTSATAVPPTVRIDLARGTVSTLAAGLLSPRTSATVTAWASGAVVAGGVAPDTGEPQPTFEIYASALGDFDGSSYPLSHARSRHGAAVLASGETLLVGGVDASGKILGSMEAVDASARRAHTGGLGSLAAPRADAVVLRLASGEILVAGGVDAAGAPISTLEWFPADASPSTRVTRDLVASARRAFVPLPAGGALAVIAPDAPTPGFQNVWVITADGALEAATPIDGALTDVRLFEGTEGAPVLWTGDRWLVWQPWAGSFTALAPAIGAPGPTGTTGTGTSDPIASPEPGLGVWIDAASVSALRFGTRGPYATPPGSAPLLATGTSFTAPDRLVMPGTPGPVAFDAAVGLSLQPGASVFVTDATYASFTLDAQTPAKTPPAIVLRDAAGNETVIDAASCALAAGTTLHVERKGDAIRASVGAGPLVACDRAPAPGARVSIGVRGVGAAPSVVRDVVITRT